MSTIIEPISILSESAKQMINSPKAIKALENNMPITFVYYSEGKGVKTKHMHQSIKRSIKMNGTSKGLIIISYPEIGKDIYQHVNQI